MKKTAVITGASGSMGSAAVRAMAAEGYRVIMVCRSRSKAERIRSKILSELPDAQIEIRTVDLSRLTEIKPFVDSLDLKDVAALFNNAGTISRNFELTDEGFEKTLTVNYLAPYVFTRLMLPKLSPDARIDNMVSLTCGLSKIGKDILCEAPEKFSQLGTYGRTKLALLLFTVALAKRYPSYYVNMSDPGVVNSNMISMGRWFDPLADIFFRPFIKSPERGVAPAVSALLGNERLQYYVGRSHKPVADKYMNHPLLDWLWDETEDKLKGICNF